MALTLNQVVKRIQNLASAHKQINDNRVGPAAEWLANGDVKYPALFIDWSNGNISKDSKNVKINFEFWFCDLCNVSVRSRENELEVQSDLTSIATDFKSMLDYTGFDESWDVSEGSGIEYFEEIFEDLVIAVKMTVGIELPYDSNRCDIPTTDYSEPNVNKMIIVNTIYTGIGTEGRTLTLSVLQNRTILMLFKGDKLLEPATSGVGLTVNQYFFTPSTGVLLFGSDIEELQFIQVLNKTQG